MSGGRFDLRRRRALQAATAPLGATLASGMVAGVWPGAAIAQSGGGLNFPSRPIRLVVGFTPGGGVDINARLLAARLTEILGQSVVVENKPGAGTNIANEYVAKAPPDGHTLLINTGAVAINMSLYKRLPFDTLRDFAPVGVFSESQNVLVTSSTKPYRSVAELIAAARARPGMLSYGSAGSGSTQHLGAELFKQKTGTDIFHVPYKGSAPAITALMGGEIDIVFINVPAILGQVKAGRLRPLASLGPRRSGQLPDVPTLKEAGVDGIELVLWYGVLAPAKTPRPIIEKLSAAIATATKIPELRSKLLEQGAEPVGGTPEAFGALLREEVDRWGTVIRNSGIQVD